MEGYSSVLKNIHTISDELANRNEILAQPERDELKLSMKIWKQNLNL